MRRLHSWLILLATLALVPQALWLALHALEHHHEIEACPDASALVHGHAHEAGTPGHEHEIASTSAAAITNLTRLPAPGLTGAARHAPRAPSGPSAEACAVAATESPPGPAAPSLAQLCILRI